MVQYTARVLHVYPPEVRVGSVSWLWRLSGEHSRSNSPEESFIPLLRPQESPWPSSGLEASGGFSRLRSPTDEEVIKGLTEIIAEAVLLSVYDSSCFTSDLSVRCALNSDLVCAWDSGRQSSGSVLGWGMTEEMWRSGGESGTRDATPVSLLVKTIFSGFPPPFPPLPSALALPPFSSFPLSSASLSPSGPLHEQVPGVPQLTAWLQSSFSPTSRGSRIGTRQTQEPAKRGDALTTSSSSDTSSGSPDPSLWSSIAAFPLVPSSSVLSPVKGSETLTSGTDMGKVQGCPSAGLWGAWQMSLVVSHGVYLGPPASPPPAPLW